MKLAKKSRHALGAMIALGFARGELVRAGEMAGARGLPKKFLDQILLELKGAGLVESVAGRNGGYSLGRGSGLVSVRDILEAVGDPIVSDEENPPTGADGPEPVAAAVARIRDFSRTQFERVTLEDLVAEEAGRAAAGESMWFI